jgi:predicted nucleic acid-binding protein
MGALNQITGDSIYIDANTLIYQVEGLSVFAGVLDPLFDRIDRGEIVAVTSELTLAEVLVKPIREGNVRIRTAYETAFSELSALQVVPVSRHVLQEAARLRAGCGLKLPDAIHAATAMVSSCTTFLTNDARFLSVGELPVALLSRMP